MRPVTEKRRPSIALASATSPSASAVRIRVDDIAHPPCFA
jgi:hypothetical protein